MVTRDYKIYCKWIIIGLGIILSCDGSQVKGQGGGSGIARIATWYQDKPGAISITFDDACYTQYDVAWPVLESLDLKATFSVVGEWSSDEASWSAEKGSFPMKRMGWKQLLELKSHGNELAAHGFTHEAYELTTPLPKLVQKMKIIKQLIEGKTGSPVSTMNYPYSHSPGNIPQAAYQAGYLFGRTGLDTVNPSSPPSMYLLATKAILNDHSPDTTAFRQWIAEAKGNWLILMYHHLFEPDSKEMKVNREMKVSNTYSLPPALFEWQMKELKQSGYWIAPLSQIGKYINERDHTTLTVRQGKRKIKIRTYTPLDPSLYDQPLTLELSLPWPAVVMKGILENSIKEKNADNFQVDFMPGATLTVYKKK